jgi:hypothetical protein
MARSKKKTISPLEQSIVPQVNSDNYTFIPSSISHATESRASYTDWYDSIYPIRDDPNNHVGPYKDFLRFNNLLEYRIPYQEFGRYVYMREPIRLCQVAWREVPVFYQTIETMTDLSNTELKLTKGSDRGRKFFTNWFDYIKIDRFKEQYFRETYRSSNTFIYRYDGYIKSNKLNKMMFGKNQKSEAAKTIELPVNYIILNPAYISMFNSLDLNNIPAYFYMVDIATRDQLKRLKQEKGTDLDFSKETNDILNNNITEVPLDTDKLYPLFYRKQDYEPFALPMGYPVLDSINMKLEFKKSDMIVTKTVESIMTMVKHGTADKDGNMVVNPLVAQALQKMFLTKQTGRTIVTTSDTSIDFVIPDLKKVMGPEKYEKLDQEINDGLMNLFFGDQKFANIMVKLRVFIDKLEKARNIFLTQFLIPEMKRVGKLAGYKPEEIPIPKFIPIRVDDTTNANRVMANLMQLGVLTAKDGIEAIELGILPEWEDLINNQKEYKAARDKGLFEPLIGGAKDGSGDAAGGRPSGTKGPKKTNKPGFKGSSSAAENQYDVIKFRKNVLLASSTANDIMEAYKNKYNKTKLTKKDKEQIKIIASHLTINENPANWKDNIINYLESLPEPNIENIGIIEEIKELQNVDDLSAALLMWSKRE